MTFTEWLAKRKVKKVMHGIDEYEIRCITDRWYVTIMLDDDTERFEKLRKTDDVYDKLIERVENGESIYSVEYCAPKILKNVYDDVAYHVCGKYDLESIMKDGIIPNGNTNAEVLETSCYLDSHKTKNIPDSFYRAQCIYMYNELSVEMLKDHVENDSVVLAVDISGLDWRIASIGLSGFCLSYGEDGYAQWIKSANLKKYGKLYWKNSYSKQEYLSGMGKKSDEMWGLDEILYMGRINPDCLSILDRSSISNYVKHEFLNVYQHVLDKAQCELNL